MKLDVVLFVLLFVLLLSGQLCVCHLSFDAWRRQHNKLYGTETEMRKRREIYYENIIQIQMLNELHPEITFEINKFADLSLAEFKRKILMTSRVPTEFPQSLYHMPNSIQTPLNFDWRRHNAVTTVKDQGTVGTCWAFGTTGNIEGQWAIKIGGLFSLSAEQLIDCDASQDVANGRADCGVFGGWPYLAMEYIKQAGGIESVADYPYCSGTGACYPCVPNGYNVSLCGAAPEYCNKSQSCSAKINPDRFVSGLKVEGFRVIPRDETVMQYSLLSIGPLSVLIDATFLQFYHSGVWDTPFCHSDTLDHAVMLVGYGTYTGVFGTKPYWIVKNSWGLDWGESGYFRLVRGKNMCGVTLEVVSAVLE